MDPSTCTVVWDSPSRDSSGSMPLGNGDIGLNVWVEDSGDLCFYISKTDSWCENLRLLKLGRIRVRLTPNPFGAGQPFRQELDPASGCIRIQSAINNLQSSILIWVDANHPVIHVEVETGAPVGLTAALEVWRTHPRQLEGKELHSAYGLSGSGQPVVADPDSVLPGQRDRVVWLHRNERSCYELLMRQQSLEDFLPRCPDPLLHRVFGALMQGPGLVGVDDQTLGSAEPRTEHRLDLFPHTAHPATADGWLRQAEGHAARITALEIGCRHAEHGRWWREFWERSYVAADGSEAARTVMRGYGLQRFITACAGRGAYPIKFNGSLFTVDGRDPQVLGETVYDADYRCWGGHYWHQNTRLPYWSMLAAGDFEMLDPFFQLYRRALPLAEFRTRRYCGHGGAFLPETMTLFGTYTGDDYGWDRTGLKPGDSPNVNIRLHLCGALETLAMMLDYRSFTGDEAFVAATLLPFAEAILRFYDEHYPRDAAGRLRIEPSQSLETWQDTVNPLPEVAGLRYALAGLLALPPGSVPADLLARWERLQGIVPELPVSDGLILAAEQIRGKRTNWENPELYAVFPYRFFQVGRPGLDLARRTYATRHERVPLPEWYIAAFRGQFTGWNQDDIHAALLGLTDEAARGVSERFATHHPTSRFPAFWGPNCDWIPDQDHGTVGMLAVQAMLLQPVGERLYVLPAWPREWDVEFKLHAPGRTTVEVGYRQGKLERLVVTPAARHIDVVLPEGLDPMRAPPATLTPPLSQGRG